MLRTKQKQCVKRYKNMSQEKHLEDKNKILKRISQPYTPYLKPLLNPFLQLPILQGYSNLISFLLKAILKYSSPEWHSFQSLGFRRTFNRLFRVFTCIVYSLFFCKRYLLKYTKKVKRALPGVAQ